MEILDELVAKAKAALEPAPAPPLDVSAVASPVDDVLGKPGIPAYTPGPAPVKPPPGMDGEACIAFLDGLTPLVVRLLCMKARIRFTPELTRECRLSEAEKAQLRLTADAAAPAIARLLQQSQNVSVGIFFISYYLIVSAKVSYIKSTVHPEAPPDEGISTDAATVTAAVGNAVIASAGEKKRPRKYVRTGKYTKAALAAGGTP